MRARIDINEVEAATKIRAKYLRAMENEEWDLLPGPTFVQAASCAPTPSTWAWTRTCWWTSIKLRHEGPPSTSRCPITADLGQRAAAPACTRRRDLAGLGHRPVDRGPAGGADGARRAQRGAAAPHPPDDPARVATCARAPPPRPTRVSLRLIPEGVVYACVRNGADELLLSDTLQPGAQTETYRAKRLRVTLGNNSVRMRVNGRTLAVAPERRRDQLRADARRPPAPVAGRERVLTGASGVC